MLYLFQMPDDNFVGVSFNSATLATLSRLSGPRLCGMCTIGVFSCGSVRHSTLVSLAPVVVPFVLFLFGWRSHASSDLSISLASLCLFGLLN